MKSASSNCLLITGIFLSHSVHAGSCGSEITSSCTINSPKSAKGTLYTIKNGAEGELSLTGHQEALYRGAVLRFEGDSSGMNVKILPEARLSADYDAIDIVEGAKTGSITIQGNVNSRFQHALNAHAKSHYATITIDRSAVLSNQSPYHPVIHIDNSATGELLFSGKGISEQNDVLMYSTDPNHLWGDGALPAGTHKLVMPDTVEQGYSKSPVTLGNNEHKLISDLPPSYHFAENSIIQMDVSFLPENYTTAFIEGTDIVFGDNSRLMLRGSPPEDKTFTLFSATGQLKPPEEISGNLFWNVTTRLAPGAAPQSNEFTVTFVAKSDHEIINSLHSMGFSDNQALAVLNSNKYAPHSVQKTINHYASEKNALKALAEELTPALAYTSTVVLDMSRKTGSAIDNRLALVYPEQIKANTDDAMLAQHFWGQVSGSKAKLKQHKDDSGYDAKPYSMTLGYDRTLPDREALIGAVFAYHNSNGDFGTAKKTDTNAWQLAVYGKINLNDYALEPQFLYTRAEHQSKRQFDGQNDKADYSGNAYGFRMLAAWWPMTFQPLIGVNVAHVDTDKHHFKVMDQRIKSASQTAYEAGAGVRYFPTRPGLSPKAQAMLWYNFSNDSLDTRYRIGNGPTLVVSQHRNKQPLSLSGLLGFDYTSAWVTSGCDINVIYRSDFSDLGFSCRVLYAF